jgi:hypothetical protein
MKTSRAHGGNACQAKRTRPEHLIRSKLQTPVPPRPVGLLVVGVGLVLLGFFFALVRGPEAVASPAASLKKSPELSALFLGGGTLTIEEQVVGIPAGEGLGAFSVGFFYPRNLLQVTVEEGPFLSSTGRATYCSGVNAEGFRELHCTSSGPDPGPTGSGTLAYIHVRPQTGLNLKPTVGNGVLAILDDLQGAAGLADVLGNGIDVSGVGDAAVVVQALEGDLNQDCVVNALDEQAIAFRFGASVGSLFYQDLYDLQPPSGDGDIDIKDVQFVFGRHGRECGEPEPTPTPTPSRTPTATITATGTPATATPTRTGTPATPTPTRTGTPATPTPTRTGTPATATPTRTGTPATATPAGTGTPGVVAPAGTGTPGVVAPAGTGTPSTVEPSASGTPATPTPGGGIALTPAPTPPLAIELPATAVATPTAAVGELPRAGGGDGGSGPRTWTSLIGLALALGVLALLYGGLRPRRGRRL